ncbi:MAG: hypothetical protein KatS3mg015_2511 [Fimbriimonadales bacterium]|nr:MAG: hypothetical protein KatS3mg015_2511 [Fimbriimonadales bacterium]
MAWLRIDDGFAAHPKVTALSLADRWRWLAILCYCARYQTDGYLPDNIAEHVRGATAASLAFGGVDVRDLRPGRGAVPCSEHGQGCPGTRDGCWGDVPELPEAAAREGIPFLARPCPRPGGTAKTVLQTAPAPAIRAFLDAAGEGAYGDPERGFAGVAGEL